jgi:thioredoxin-related protein
MRKIVFLILFAIALFATENDYVNVKWLTDVEEAKQTAHSKKKPIMLFMHSVNCYYCPIMEQKTFSDKSLQEKIYKDTVPLALDNASDSDSIEESVNDQAPERFIVSMTPAIYFMGPDEEKLSKKGKEHMVIYGYWTAQELKEWIDDAKRRFVKLYGEKYGIKK